LQRISLKVRISTKKTAAVLFLLALAVACGRKKTEVKPERRDITETVFASGRLEPVFVYNLAAQTEGIITSLTFEEGDTVRTGQVMGVIDNKPNLIAALSSQQLAQLAEINASPQGPLLKQAEQRAKLLAEKLKQDSLQWQRYENLFTSNSVSKLDLERNRLNYESSRTEYQNALENYRLQKQQAEQQAITQRSQKEISKVSEGYNEIRSQLAGKVYRRMKENGDYVRRGELIAVIGDARRMYASLNVDESNIAKVKAGQEVVIELNTRKGKPYKARITKINPAFDEATQSFSCRAEFLEQPDFAVYGTQLQANVIIAKRKNVLVIPKANYNYNGQVNVKGKGLVHVEGGFISGDWVEIVSGLNDEDVLVSQ
jgi:multidrug efflux pump subunit AcrA (membrane-fusion protein)